jgi:hypothetical protein
MLSQFISHPQGKLYSVKFPWKNNNANKILKFHGEIIPIVTFFDATNQTKNSLCQWSRRLFTYDGVTVEFFSTSINYSNRNKFQKARGIESRIFLKGEKKFVHARTIERKKRK